MGAVRVKEEALRVIGLFQTLPRLVVFDLDYTLWPFYWYTNCDMGRWCESKLLGEYVGGSAVRSIYFVSKMHIISASQTCNSNHAFADRKDDRLLLISVGAMQVLTSWLLQYKSTDNDKLHNDGSNTDSEYMSSSTSGFSSISFQWLSTHMPPKFASTHQKVKILETSENENSSTMKSSMS